jgi:hypothetical protein
VPIPDVYPPDTDQTIRRNASVAKEQVPVEPGRVDVLVGRPAHGMCLRARPGFNDTHVIASNGHTVTGEVPVNDRDVGAGLRR